MRDESGFKPGDHLVSGRFFYSHSCIDGEPRSDQVRNLALILSGASVLVGGVVAGQMYADD